MRPNESASVRGSNASSIKLNNRKTVLRLIQRGQMSRAAIAEHTHQSRGGLTPVERSANALTPAAMAFIEPQG